MLSCTVELLNAARGLEQEDDRLARCVCWREKGDRKESERLK